MLWHGIKFFLLYAFQNDSNIDYTVNILQTSVTPLAQRHRLTQQRSVPISSCAKTAKFQQPRYSTEDTLSRQIKPQLTRGYGIASYVDHLTGDRRLDPGTRESSTGD